MSLAGSCPCSIDDVQAIDRKSCGDPVSGVIVESDRVGGSVMGFNISSTVTFKVMDCDPIDKNFHAVGLIAHGACGRRWHRRPSGVGETDKQDDD